MHCGHGLPAVDRGGGSGGLTCLRKAPSTRGVSATPTVRPGALAWYAGKLVVFSLNEAVITPRKTGQGKQ